MERQGPLRGRVGLSGLSVRVEPVIGHVALASPIRLSNSASKAACSLTSGA